MGLLRYIETCRIGLGVARLEAPLWCRLARSWEQRDLVAVQQWSDFFLATRETGELRAETMQMGYSLARLLADIGEFESAALNGLAEVAHITFPAAFTFAVTGWHIPAQSALIAYLWSWLENQVMAAVKCVPLGQTDGNACSRGWARICPRSRNKASPPLTISYATSRLRLPSPQAGMKHNTADCSGHEVFETSG